MYRCFSHVSGHLARWVLVWGLLLLPQAVWALGFTTTVAQEATRLTIELADDEHLDAETISSPLPYEVVSEQPFVVDFPPHLTTIPLTYQLCVGTVCYPPAVTNIAVSGAELPLELSSVGWETAVPGTGEEVASNPGEARLVGYVQPAELLAFLEQQFSAVGEGNQRPQPVQGGDATPFSEAGEVLPEKLGWALLGLVVAGGLLNLTPCTLPLIPVTLLVLGVGRKGETSRRRRVLIGCAYALGILLAYVVLAMLSTATGNLLGGYAASPWFNLVVAGLLVLLALRPPDLSRFRPQAGVTARRDAGASSESSTGGRAGGLRQLRAPLVAFFYGLLMAALAGACTAPVLLSALTWSAQLSAAGKHLLGLLLPCAIGLGFALPWPFLAAGLSILPRPGAWMGRLSKVFTLLVLVLAAYYLFLAVKLFLPANETAGTETSTYNLAVAADLDRLEADLAARGRPTLLLFSAEWCKNCHVMQRTTLAEASVTNFLAAQELELWVLRADHPGQPPAAGFLAAHGVQAFPTLLLVKP